MIRSCHTHGRADLAERLTRRRTRLLHQQLRVLVVGIAAQGRSRLINALVNAPVCGLLPDGGTEVPTVVRHAGAPVAHLIQRDSASADWTAAVALRAQIPLATDRLAPSLAAAAANLPAGIPVHTDVGIPRALLADGLVLIDAPALSGDSVAAAQELADQAGADLVLYTCETGRRLGDAEVRMIAALSQVFPGLVVVLTKADYAVDWRRDLAESRRLLTEAGVTVAVTAVSSSLRAHAVRTGDEALNKESGFADLIVHLRQMVAAKPDRLARATAAALGRIAVQELTVPLRAEMERQESSGTSEAAAHLQATHQHLDDLRKSTVRWQNRLSDEVTDLMADVEHDLRERVKAIIAEADEFFTDADPAKSWDEFEPWLRQSLQELAQTSMAWLTERSEWMARRTADMFPAEAGDVLPPTALAVTSRAVEGAYGLEAPPVAAFTPGQKLFIGLRGSYGGIVMFGLATSLAGMSLINPISIGGGALFGGKSVRDESKTLLKRRQAEARTAVRQYVDDIFAKLNKDARDSVRRAQRALRDHFTAVTEDLQEEAMESLRNAKAAADREAAARELRGRTLRAELTRLSELHTQSLALSDRART
ncbi:MAG TPA: GTP-binding protein [Actinoplanes sp.]|nr:GTP-binding protein [Actinoplanes sp.]